MSWFDRNLLLKQPQTPNSCLTGLSTLPFILRIAASRPYVLFLWPVLPRSGESPLTSHCQTPPPPRPAQSLQIYIPEINIRLANRTAATRRPHCSTTRGINQKDIQSINQSVSQSLARTNELQWRLAHSTCAKLFVCRRPLSSQRAMQVRSFLADALPQRSRSAIGLRYRNRGRSADLIIIIII